jgi:hypothetical protein
LHPGARAKLKRVRALLRMPPLLSPAEQAAWAPPAPNPQSSPVAAVLADVLEPAPLRCPHCGTNLIGLVSGALDKAPARTCPLSNARFGHLEKCYFPSLFSFRLRLSLHPPFCPATQMPNISILSRPLILPDCTVQPLRTRFPNRALVLWAASKLAAQPRTENFRSLFRIRDPGFLAREFSTFLGLLAALIFLGK